MMEEKEKKIVSLFTFLLVTGFSFLSYTMIFRAIVGVINDLFLWIGCITFSLGLITGIAFFITSKKSKTEEVNQDE